MNNEEKNVEEMDFEEWYAYMEELYKERMQNSQEEIEEAECGNPYGAGRYGFIRSSKDWQALIRGKEAEFRPESNRWFEHIYCCYSCWRDGQADLEFDGEARDKFDEEHSLANYMEAFYELEYGDTRNQVAEVSFHLSEHEGPKYREFHFDLKDISKDQLEECFVAIEKWQCTGKLELWHFSTYPCVGPWKTE